MADIKYGVIKEQGDLGLFFDELNKKDNKLVNESFDNSKKKDKEDKDKDEKK